MSEYPAFVQPVEGLFEDAPPPPRRRRRRVWYLAALLAVVLGVVAVLTIAPPHADGPPAVRYLMARFGGYEPAVQQVASAESKYTADWKSGKLYLFVPATQAGQDYILEFLKDLQMLHAGGVVMAGVSGESEAVLDKSLYDYLNSLRDLEKKFRALAPLGPAGHTTDPTNGRVVDYTGKTSPAGEHERLEALARDFTAEPDAAGSYIPSATALVQDFGLSVDWDFGKLATVCPSKEPRDQYVVAAFCTATPLVVYGNRQTAAAAQVFYSPIIVSTMKHELSHYLITQRCGTPNPTLAGKSYEAVTNSYAVLFMDASYKALQPHPSDPHQEYRMTPDTDEIARKIHSGTCK